MRGDADQRRRRRILIGDLLGRWIEPTFVDCGVLGERALASQQSLVASPDPVALAILRHARADCLDHPGQIASDDKRQRQVCRNQARANVGIDRVERHRGDLDEDLAGGGFWRWQVSVNDVFGRAYPFNVRSFQGA